MNKDAARSTSFLLAPVRWRTVPISVVNVSLIVGVAKKFT